IRLAESDFPLADNEDDGAGQLSLVDALLHYGVDLVELDGVKSDVGAVGRGKPSRIFRPHSAGVQKQSKKCDKQHESTRVHRNCVAETSPLRAGEEATPPYLRDVICL